MYPCFLITSLFPTIDHDQKSVGWKWLALFYSPVNFVMWRCYFFNRLIINLHFVFQLHCKFYFSYIVDHLLKFSAYVAKIDFCKVFKIWKVIIWRGGMTVFFSFPLNCSIFAVSRQSHFLAWRLKIMTNADEVATPYVD